MKKKKSASSSPFRKTYFLFLFLIILASMVFFVDPWLRNRNKAEPETKVLFADFDKEALSKIEINKGSDKVTFNKKDNKWLISSAENYEAEQSAISTLLDKIPTLESKDVISSNDKKYDLFEVTEDKGVVIKALDQKDKVVLNFIIGKAGQVPGSQYLRINNQKDVYLVLDYSNGLINTFYKPQNDWKNKQIAAFNQDKVKKIAIVFDKEKFVLQKDKMVFNFLEPIKFEAEKSKTDDLLSSTLNYRTLDFITSENLADYGLDKEKVKVFLEFDDGSTKILYFGQKKDEEGFYYVRAEGQKTIFKLTKEEVEKLKIKVDDFKKKVDTSSGTTGIIEEVTNPK